MTKKLLSILVCLSLLVMPFCGVMSVMPAVASSASAPTVSVNIDPYDTIHPNTAVTVSYTAKSGTLAACDTRLEGVSLGTDATVTFTPAQRGLSDGVYTLMMEATDSAGNVAIEPLTFRVSHDVELDASCAGVTTTVYAVDALDFTASYGSSADGTVDPLNITPYAADDQYALQYTDDTVSVSSASGIPYQVFDIDLAGKTDGDVVVHYSGSTKAGERMTVKAYNVTTGAWDELGTFFGEGVVSACVDVASHNDGGKVHILAMLDYVTNGSNTMIWSTDPQHYTKFEDLHEYYYTVYQYAAEKYQNGEAAYIMTTGDLVDDIPSAAVSTKQWGIASKAMSYVEAVGMPNGLVSGNHDVNTVSNTDFSAGVGNVDYSKFAATFPATRQNNERWFGGSLNNNTSHYDLITVGNVDFIVLYLGYGVEATDETIAWANNVLQTYRHRTAIVATHQYLDARDAVRYGRGELIFNTIVDPNPNVKMVICGHDDGSLCLEKTASDGRIVYELLADYQFVEAEDPDFYANEHWIGSVPSCCGDGYIRLLTVEGDTLSSITYSPVTGRYNPYGDRENVSIDLDCGTPDRVFATSRFSAAVLGGVTSASDVDRISVYTDGTTISYSAVTYAAVPSAPAASDDTPWPATTYGAAATPSNPYYAHAAKEAPAVAYKVDLLAEIGLGEHPVVNQWTPIGNNALNVQLDLNKTPYLYYSFAQPTGSNFTFAFLNNSTTAPWLTFLDATKGGNVFNSTAEVWDSYVTTNAQYFTNSVTGCIDLRDLSIDDVNWTINQLTFYNQKYQSVVVSYLFVGSAPIDTAMPQTTYGAPATPAQPFATHAAAKEPVVEYKADLLAAAGYTNNKVVTGYTPYDGSFSLTVDLDKTPYLYYAFAMPEGGSFTFGLYNNTSTAPWYAFLDANTSGTTLNYPIANWNAYQNFEQYFTTSATGCIDMRTLTTSTDADTWTVEKITLYNASGTGVMLQYLFFGSAAVGEASAADTAAFDALYAQACTINTAGYTTATATELTQAMYVARVVDKTDAAALAAAYARLKAAIGGLETPVTVRDTTGLVSIKNYSLMNTNWVCNSTGAALTSDSSFLDVIQTDDGMILSRSAAATHDWPHARYVGSGVSYSVTPYEGLYLKIDVNAKNRWAINFSVSQGSRSYQIVRVNCDIENSFNAITADGSEGVFSGVYDISHAFREQGIEPTAPFTIEGVNLFVIGSIGTGVTYNHLELLTGPATSSVVRYDLQDAINCASSLTQSMYTTASWNALSTALTAANKANSDTSYTQPKVNQATFDLNNAIDALVLVTNPESDGSLLPADLGMWTTDDPSSVTISRQNGATMIYNAVADWPRVTHTLREPMRVRVDRHQLEFDMTVAGATNILMLVDGEWITITKYINSIRLNGDDLLEGTYIAEVPLNTIAEIAHKDAVLIEAVRIFTVSNGNPPSSLTIRRMAIDDVPETAWNRDVTYGAAATPSNPYYAHCAKNEPIVAYKTDLLAAIGLNQPTVNGFASYGDSKMHLTIDLNKTPYLYVSFLQPTDSNFTFGLYNDTSLGAPYFAFYDASLGGSAMNTTVPTWDSYGETGAQYAKTSVTACIDMRTLLTDASATSWRVNGVSFYNTLGKDVVISYMFFGSAAISDGNTQDATVAGDVNFDGLLSTLDARLCLETILGSRGTFTDYQKTLADFKIDNVFNTSDVREMLLTIVKQ